MALGRDGIPYTTSASMINRVIDGRKVPAVKLLSELSSTDDNEWTWGRFQYVTNKMVSEGLLFFTRDADGNKVFSLTPFDEEHDQPVREARSGELDELANICLLQNDIMMAIASGTLLDYKPRLEKIGVTDVVNDAMLGKNKIGAFLIEKALKDLNITPETIENINKKLGELVKR